MPKPIRVFYSGMTQRFYATSHYAIKAGQVVCTGEKFDVTDDIAGNIIANEIEFEPIGPMAIFPEVEDNVLARGTEPTK
jgi:hypothetical protein